MENEKQTESSGEAQQNSKPQPPQNQQSPQPPYAGQPYAEQPNPAQPYGMYPAQPYGGQPYGTYPAQPTQPYGAYPTPTIIQQTIVQQPVVTHATQGEKDAAFGAAGSVFMLVLCIANTIYFVSNLFTLGGLTGFVLNLLILIGAWITFANAKKKKLSSTGISLIRIPYVISFVFSVFAFISDFVFGIITLDVVGLVFGILLFVLNCICFSSVNGALINARDIYQNKTIRGRRSGTFAAVMMIITSAISLIQVIVDYVRSAFLTELIKEIFLASEMPSELAEYLVSFFGGGSVTGVVAAVIGFLVGICGAIVILQFVKKLDQNEM